MRPSAAPRSLCCRGFRMRPGVCVTACSASLLLHQQSMILTSNTGQRGHGFKSPCCERGNLPRKIGTEREVIPTIITLLISKSVFRCLSITFSDFLKHIKRQWTRCLFGQTSSDKSKRTQTEILIKGGRQWLSLLSTYIICSYSSSCSCFINLLSVIYAFKPARSAFSPSSVPWRLLFAVHDHYLSSTRILPHVFKLKETLCVEPMLCNIM